VKTLAPVKSKTTIDVLRADSLARIPWLAHGFSTRASGFSNAYGRKQLNLGFTTDDTKAAVEKNRQLFVSQIIRRVGRRASRPSFEVIHLVTTRQIHSDLIHCISAIPEKPLAGDGLIARTPGLLLGVLTADCLPVILVDVKTRAIGVFHAGWRGTAKRIVEKGVGEMHRWFGSRPQDLKAAIGPGIRNCCYEVGQEVRDTFESQFDYADDLFRETKDRDEIHEKYPLLFLTSRAPGHSELPKKIFLDVPEANRRQLLAAGVLAKNITDVGLCTSCHPELFFSHRRDDGVTGRMMAVVGIAP
jgi:polyphenol oxidase